MPTKQVQVTVAPGPSVTVVAIHIDGQLVPLVNNQGSIRLDSPGRYLLVWHFAGNSGDTLSVLVTSSGSALLEMKKSRVPVGENAGAGIARFDI
jgi:hypothetical protein